MAGVFRTITVVLTGADFVPGFSAGPGLLIQHSQGIVIGHGAVIGAGCTILQQVTLGEVDVGPTGDRNYPTVGDGVTIGAGARVLGGISVGDGSTIGAGAVVIDDVPPHATVVGVPARLVSGG